MASAEPAAEAEPAASVEQAATNALHVVGAAILRDGCCLVAQRSERMSLPLQWEFPGGKVEPDEDPRAALQRELLEELGIVVDVHELIATGETVDVRLDVYRVELVTGEPSPIEHAHVAWLGPHELIRLDWADADVPVVPRVVALLSRQR